MKSIPRRAKTKAGQYVVQKRLTTQTEANFSCQNMILGRTLGCKNVKLRDDISLQWR